MGQEELEKIEKELEEEIKEPGSQEPAPGSAEPIKEPEPSEKKRRATRSDKGSRKKQKIVRDTGGKFTAAPKVELPDFSVYIPLISNLVNISFKRLSWAALTYDEAKLLTNAAMEVYYKYIPEFLEKYSEEMNLLLTAGMIIVPRMMTPKELLPDDKTP